MDSEEREGTGTRTFRKWVVVANEGSVRERERDGLTRVWREDERAHFIEKERRCRGRSES